MASIQRSMLVSAGVSNATTSTGTLYTAPASGYAILNLYVQSGAVVGVEVGGNIVFDENTGFHGTIYVGPSQAVTVFSNIGTATVSISGVEFTISS